MKWRAQRNIFSLSSLVILGIILSLIFVGFVIYACIHFMTTPYYYYVGDECGGNCLICPSYVYETPLEHYGMMHMLFLPVQCMMEMPYGTGLIGMIILWLTTGYLIERYVTGFRVYGEYKDTTQIQQ